MNWIKPNKGLAVFLAFSVLLAGALASLVFRASARREEGLKSYTALLGQLNGLQSQSPYPDQVSLKALQLQKKEHKESIEELQRRLNTMEMPLTPLTEVQFQDALRDTVQRVSAKAAASGMKLPEKFYMGFDQYQGAPPRREAASALGRELKAIESIVTQLADSSVASLTKLERSPLPEEVENQKADDGGKEPQGGKGVKARRQLASKSPFEVSFVCTQAAFRAAFNRIVSSKEQFCIPRLVEIRNEKDKGPLKAPPSSASGATPAGAPAASSPEPAVNAQAGAQISPQAAGGVSQTELRYLVGDEKLEVTLALELVDFAEAPVR
jgi:hypothetical protein